MYIITSAWTELIQQFFPIFTTPTAQNFLRLMTGWILCTVRRTVTGIIPFADPLGLRAHDAYHRFFPDARWSMTTLWRLLTKILVQTFYRSGIIIPALDDTLFHHSGRKVNGAGWWRDAVRSTKKSIVYAYGLNLVVLTLQIQPPWGGEPLGLPINMRLHRKKVVSGRCRRFLCNIGRTNFERNYDYFPNQTRCQLVRPAAETKKESTRTSPHQRQETGQAGKDGRPYSELGNNYISSARQNHQASGLYSSGSLVQGQPQTNTAGYQPGPRWQRKGRFLFYNRFEYDCRRSSGMLQRQMGNRRYFQEYKTAYWRTTAKNVQRQRPGTCSRFEPLAVLGGLAVVSQAKVQPKIFHYSAVVSPEDKSLLCRCNCVPSSRALEGENKLYVREIRRTG